MEVLDAFNNETVYEEAGLSEKVLKVFELMPASVKEPPYAYYQHVNLKDEQ